MDTKPICILKIAPSTGIETASTKRHMPKLHEDYLATRVAVSHGLMVWVLLTYLLYGTTALEVSTESFFI